MSKKREKETGGDIFDKAIAETLEKSKFSTNAFRVVAWRCPNCGKVNISAKSKTHIGSCVLCEKRIEVLISNLAVATAVSLETA